MYCILFGGAPFQIAHLVVGSVAILVVNLWQVVRVRDERIGYQSMQQGVFAMRWGYTMPDGKPMFNARSETAAGKPLFADGMKQRRCLIPATCYFEWEKRGGEKIKHAIATQGSGMIYLAGIYRREGNQAACSILTREAAECVAHIHHRMPVILPAEAIPDWLNPRFDAVEVLRAAQTNMNFTPV